MKYIKRLILVLFCFFLLGSTLLWQRNERDYALTEAISRNDIAKVEKLLDAGVDPNALWSGYDLKATAYRLMGRDPFDGGPLHSDYRMIRWTQNPQMRQLLIAHGARP
ncbi:hypothetical protein [Armatimonas rosea]|uniref:Ankyrin repeat domain-containing protein n=1 Tax=Armatimonas rosea TaxID=685828 RepID=A0A7W9SQR1_ARMRO|nr:hypothetical protein [Armatimonas rosea]MBB6050710.1 hypothetical protein [Armatimonas rosea]